MADLSNTGTTNANSAYQQGISKTKNATIPDKISGSDISMGGSSGTYKSYAKISQSSRDAQNDVFSSLDTAITLLETLPYLNEESGSVTFEASPLGVLLKILNEIGVGEDKIKNWIIDFMVYMLPSVEMGVKTALLSNIKSIISCADDPRIPRSLRKSPNKYYFENGNENVGITIPIDAIDPKGVLSMSPYSKEGWANYFGVMQYANSSNRMPVYKLLRAEDFNAFLWFVIHKSALPSPTKVAIDDNALKFKPSNTELEYLIDTQNGGKSILSKMSIIPQYTEDNPKDKIYLGQTFVQNGATNSLSVCFDKVNTITEDGEVKTKNDVLLPVSSDWGSFNWYADKTNYYNGNLGFPYEGQYNRDYSKDSAICNLQLMMPYDEDLSYNGSNSTSIKLTILPEPYVYVPYLDTGEPLWRFRKILFDAEGNPDPNGNFSLPTYKTTSSGNSYVHNTACTLDNSGIYDYVNSHPEIEEEWQTVYLNISNEYKKKIEEREYTPTKIAEQYKSIEISIFYQIIKGAEITNETDLADKKAYVLMILDDALKVSYNKERNNTYIDVNKHVKFNIGENDDKCALYINIENGNYFLASSDDITVKAENVTKHLVECYNGLTLYEFNYDYIMSQKLFDPGVVCYNLLSNVANGGDISTFTLTSSVSRDTNDYSFGSSSQRIMQIVRNIVELEDAELADCFYRFSNDNFIDMLNESEKKRFNRLQYTDSSAKADLSEARAILSTFSSSASKEEQRTILNRAIESVFGVVADSNNDIALRDKSSVKLDLVTNMLSMLAYVLIDSLLTPKVLLVIALNKVIMGDDSESITTEDLLNGMKGVVVGVVKEIRDLIIKKLLDYVMDLIGPIASEMAAKVELEQYQVYIDLIKSLISLFKSNKSKIRSSNSAIYSILSKYGRNGMDDYDVPTVLDNVDYADIISDILSDNDESPVNNC